MAQIPNGRPTLRNTFPLSVAMLRGIGTLPQTQTNPYRPQRKAFAAGRLCGLLHAACAASLGPWSLVTTIYLILKLIVTKLT